MIKAIIFDLDGTIINSEVYFRKYLLRSRGRTSKFLEKVPDNYETIISKTLGMSLPDIYDYLDRKYGMKLTKTQFLKKLNFIIKYIYKFRVRLLPNFKKLIKQIDTENYKVALTSSASRNIINIVLNRFKLEKYFHVIVSSDDIKGHSKPDPHIYKLTSKILKIKPEYCLVFEDAENGIISVKKAGMKCIGIRNGYNDDQNLDKADRIIDNFKEVNIKEIKKL